MKPGGSTFIRFERNSLTGADSPYLRQHADNPVWWQEWSPDIREYAREAGKIIFISVGYATCHWCHVMAQEAFSDRRVADFLNAHFVSVKVDREIRPDIDQYCMQFLTSLSGHGGWPLNIFLTPDLHPIYALTYAPASARFGHRGFLDVLHSVRDAWRDSGDVIPDFIVPDMRPTSMPEEHIVGELAGNYDDEFGGFGAGAKFPTHTTLLFMLYYCEATHSQALERMLTGTLEAMVRGGLQDHLQGGFFRYCVDRQWMVPHFEKMAYDQGLLLWVFALAYRVFGDEIWRITAQRIVQCLEQTFEHHGLFLAGLDADTDHSEGAAYLWTDDEIRSVLTGEQFERFKGIYSFTDQVKIHGRYHLIKAHPGYVLDVEDLLLEQRRKRRQPNADRLIVTSWNCLIAIGLVHASRYLGERRYSDKAAGIFNRLLDMHSQDGRIYRSSFEGRVHRVQFLEDHAAMLLLSTFLEEEFGGYAGHMENLYRGMQRFRLKTIWNETCDEGDFRSVPAQPNDYSTPSSVSLAEVGEVRYRILRGEICSATTFRHPLDYSFLDIGALIRNGWFHVVESPEFLAWARLPINSIQIRGTEIRDCFAGACIREVPYEMKTSFKGG